MALTPAGFISSPDPSVMQEPTYKITQSQLAGIVDSCRTRCEEVSTLVRSGRFDLASRKLQELEAWLPGTQAVKVLAQRIERQKKMVEAAYRSLHPEKPTVIAEELQIIAQGTIAPATFAELTSTRELLKQHFEYILINFDLLTARDNFENTILHRIFACLGIEYCRKYLLRLKPSLPSLINVQNAEGKTALHLAARSAPSHTAAIKVELLLEQGARTDIPDKNGKCASEYSLVEKAKMKASSHVPPTGAKTPTEEKNPSDSDDLLHLMPESVLEETTLPPVEAVPPLDPETPSYLMQDPDYWNL